MLSEAKTTDVPLPIFIRLLSHNNTKSIYLGVHPKDFVLEGP